MNRVDDPPLTIAQHQRVKRASPYAYRQYVAREAARRESHRCLCEIDPGVQPRSVVIITSIPTAGQTIIGYARVEEQRLPFVAVHVYVDVAGAHMRPECPHSELWRTTRPMAAVTRYYMRTGYWPPTELPRRPRLVA